MEFIAKKYTVLMGNEPLTLWVKNNQVQSAKFMDKKIELSLDAEAIRLIKDNPTRVVNGANLQDNIQFTKSVSKMMSSKLELAIAKGDLKTLSRYARSELVPENMKMDFLAAINRQNGLRGVLTRAVNKTNAIFQNLAKKIDRFFNKVNDHVANKKLDPYLSKYQLAYVNKAPPLSAEDVRGHVDPKLMELAEDFFKQKGLDKRQFDPDRINDSVVLNEFLQKAVSKGYDLKDSKVAIYKVENHSILESNTGLLFQEAEKNTDLKQTIQDLQERLHKFEKIEAAPNITINDFEILSKDLSPVDRIDVLATNKGYLSMSPEQKAQFEDLHIFKVEPVEERAEEAAAIHQNIVEPKVETIIDRTPSIDFYDKSIQSKINQEWQTQQTKNRSSAEPTRDFMNISAVRFNGVSKPALEKWAEVAKSNSKIDATTIDKFVSASLRNAEALTVIGILNRVEDGVYKFADNFAKQALYNNIDKTVAQIQEANQGIKKEDAMSKNEIKERVAHMSSPESFKNMLTPTGELDSQKLFDYAQKLQSVAAALHERESPSKAVTREDLQRANQGVQRTQGIQNER